VLADVTELDAHATRLHATDRAQEFIAKPMRRKVRSFQAPHPRRASYQGTNMKTIGLALALVAMLFAPPVAETAKVGDIAPEFGGEWYLSETHTLAALRGRVVLIDFWRTW